MPPSPAGLYRITQGLHVATGIAAIPLLLAKLWSVYPRLFSWPPFRDPLHLIERLSLVVLVGGSLFMLFTGTANVERWYPWRFFFPAGHYWAAWITIGALVMHIGAKLPVVRRVFGAPPCTRTSHPPAGNARTARVPHRHGRGQRPAHPVHRRARPWGRSGGSPCSRPDAPTSGPRVCR